MSVWSPQIALMLVGLIALLVFAIIRVRAQSRHRNSWRRKSSGQRNKP